MTPREQRLEACDQGQVRRSQRKELEADLTRIAELIEVESGAWSERRAAVRTMSQKLDRDGEDGADATRMAWYTAAYQDAQQALVMAHSLIERYNDVAGALSVCQQELMQLPRDHRRG